MLIVDELASRRTWFASVIERWAYIKNLVVEHIAPSEMSACAARKRDVRLIILSVGGHSLNEYATSEMIATAAELFPGRPCSVISDRAAPDEAVVAARLGLQAYISTRMEVGTVCEALTFILGGGSIFPREALLYLSGSNGQSSILSRAREGEQGTLTRRQSEVLGRLSLGKSNKVIAHDLNVHESTVKVHVREIMRKLGATNRTQAALMGASLANGGTR